MTPAELIKYTGATGPEVDFQAQQALEMAEALIGAYTRGRHRNRLGEHRPGVEAVLVSVAARILANPEQVQQREQVGPYSFYRDAGFQGFNLVELEVLNRYRRRAV